MPNQPRPQPWIQNFRTIRVSIESAHHDHDFRSIEFGGEINVVFRCTVGVRDECKVAAVQKLAGITADHGESTFQEWIGASGDESRKAPFMGHPGLMMCTGFWFR